MRNYQIDPSTDHNVEFIDTTSGTESIIYWFSVDGDDWAISDINSETTLLDCDGCPVEPCNDRDGIHNLLMPLVGNLNK